MSVNSQEYKEQYEKFAQNAAFAVRAWHYHIYLEKRANENSTLRKALNQAPKFWLDQRYTSVQTTIIFLGKVFDTDRRSYNIDKMLKAAHKVMDYFSKSELRKEKIESVGEFEGIDEYIENTTELDSNDLKNISSEVKKAKTIWQRVKPLRDQVYAHNQMLSDQERTALFKSVNYEDIKRLLQILLNVSEALWQAEFNGKKPDFSSDHIKPIQWAEQEVEKLIVSLLANT